ncbi:MAG: hypothetical protein JXQ66_05550 [Campylobacterales bacterium]|nr:hypothetical protein [Campylobacterales bacterium]
MKLTIDEYSKKYKMSKEMINSKIKNNQLKLLSEDGVNYIQTQDKTVSNQVATNTKKATVGMVISLYQNENKFLKEKIEKLEDKIDRLIEEKENMLRAERDRIESIYIQKDKQIRDILDLINSQIVVEKNTQIHDVPHYEITHKMVDDEDNLVELKKHLKSLNINSEQKKVIKDRFENSYDDIRVIKKDEKFYLDFSKYDYSDLLK